LRLFVESRIMDGEHHRAAVGPDTDLHGWTRLSIAFPQSDGRRGKSGRRPLIDRSMAATLSGRKAQSHAHWNTNSFVENRMNKNVNVEKPAAKQKTAPVKGGVKITPRSSSDTIVWGW
jgi:hypothetical protein